MSPNKLRRLCSSPDSPNSSNKQNKRCIALTFTILFATAAFAQQTIQTQPPDNTQVAAATNATVVAVPAGTRIALVLTQPVQTRYLHRGDDIYAQIVSPVTAGNEVVIPPGTFGQGKVDTLERRGGRGELHLQSISITFPDCYVIPIEGPVTLESPDGYAVRDPGNRRAVGAVLSPLAGAGIGALVGHSYASSHSDTITNTLPPGCTGPPPGCLSSSFTAPGNTAKGTLLGAMAGGAIGAVASIAILVNSHHFFIDVGAPVAMTLQHPLSLPQDQVAEAIRDAEEHPGPEGPVAVRPQQRPAPDNDNGPTWCETPGTPGTPDVDIPGTPAVGDSPGTPAIHIPGIPATPPSAHLCP